MCSNLPTSFWLHLYFLGKLCFKTRRHSSGFWSFSAGGSDSHLCPEGHSSRSVPLPHRAERSGREKGCERFTAESREQRRGPGVTFPVSPSWGHCWMASRAVCLPANPASRARPLLPPHRGFCCSPAPDGVPRWPGFLARCNSRPALNPLFHTCLREWEEWVFFPHSFESRFNFSPRLGWGACRGGPTLVCCFSPKSLRPFSFFLIKRITSFSQAPRKGNGPL